jgi:predicted NAD/FAD-binding protein
MHKQTPRKNIAIVGSGGSGLAAVWALGHSRHSVSLYEAKPQLGGHAHAVRFQNETTGKSCVVDTAFMIVNGTTYRTSHLYRRHLGKNK